MTLSINTRISSGKIRSICLMLAALITSGSQSESALGQTYSITSVLVNPTDPVYHYSGALTTGFSSNGLAVGQVCDPFDPYIYGATWQSSTTATILSTIGGTNSVSTIYSINSSGVIVGSSDGPTAQTATVWINGLPNDLRTFEPITWQYQPHQQLSIAVDINDTGTVAGWSFYNSHQYSAFVYDGGGLIALGTLPYPFNYGSQAAAINSSGQITGLSRGNGRVGGFLWTPTTPNGTTGTMQDLFPDGDGGFTVMPNDVNDNDQIIGSFQDGQPFLWSPTSGGVQIGSNSQVARALNNAGVIVGDSNNSEVSNVDPQVALKWDGANWVNLNDLISNMPGVYLQSATGINDSGQILAYGKLNINDTHTCGFILTPDATDASLDLQKAKNSQRVLSKIPATTLKAGKLRIKK